MFCDGCGAALNPPNQFCASCGKRVIPSAGPQAGHVAAPASAEDRVRRNIGTLALLWLAYGILRVVGLVWLFTIGRVFLPWMMGTMGSHGWMMGSWGWERLVPLGIYTGGAFAAVFAAAYLFLAWGLSERQPWARTMGIVLGFLALLRFPLGSALGIYTLWVLLPEPSRREYQQIAHA